MEWCRSIIFSVEPFVLLTIGTHKSSIQMRKRGVQERQDRGGQTAPPRFRQVDHAALVCDIDCNWLRFNEMASARPFA